VSLEAHPLKTPQTLETVKLIDENTQPNTTSKSQKSSSQKQNKKKEINESYRRYASSRYMHTDSDPLTELTSRHRRAFMHLDIMGVISKLFFRIKQALFSCVIYIILLLLYLINT